MKIRNKYFGGFAETDDAQAESLIAGGEWESAEDAQPRKEPAKKAPAKKAAPKKTTTQE